MYLFHENFYRNRVCKYRSHLLHQRRQRLKVSFHDEKFSRKIPWCNYERVKIGDVDFVCTPSSCCHVEQRCGTMNKNIWKLFSFSEERCLACNPVETYENILDNFCRADFGTYLNSLIHWLHSRMKLQDVWFWLFCSVDVCVLLGYGAASLGVCFLTFQNNLNVTSSGVEISKKNYASSLGVSFPMFWDIMEFSAASYPGRTDISSTPL